VSNLVLSIAALAMAVFPDGAPSAPRNNSIRQQDLKADLFFLAGDGFRGRLTSSAENDLATEFIASRFERLGLKRIGTDGTFFQRFQLLTAALGSSNTLRIEGGGQKFVFPSGQKFFPMPFSPSGQADGALAFLGFGISARDLGHDDYQGTDVRGKIALVLDHEPGEDDPKSVFDGLVTSEHATAWRKALNAQEKGAAGILFVSDVHNHRGGESFESVARSVWPERPPRIRRYMLQDWVERVHIPAGEISSELVKDLLRGAKVSFEELAKAAEKPRAGQLPDIGTIWVELTTEVRHEVIPDRSAVAALEGSDPKLKDEWVVISCHHDHEGADGERIFNGADDNGSGTVGLLEIAEAYALAAQGGQRPKRSILFAAFNSEERGLLGSWAFVERPLVPLDRIAAVLNMDMVGRDEEVPEGGGRRFRGLPVQSAESNHNAVNLLGYSKSSALAHTIEAANSAFGLKIKKVLDNNPSNLLRRSDQWPFLQKGVPAVFFHTGLHPDYHTPGDRPERINYEKMEGIVRLVHQASWDLAEQANRPRLGSKTNETAERARADR
jgi:hypothetical protein